MKGIIKKSPYLLFLLVIPMMALVYKFLNTRPTAAVDLSTALDQSIPFLSIFIVPYILWYGYIFCYLVYFCFKNTEIFLKTLVLIVAAEIVCFVIYFFFQTTVPRPAISGDGFLNQLVVWIYAKDKPYNCFPSIHVLTTFTIMLASLHIKNKSLFNTLCIHIIGTSIIVSTLFVKQHVIFDMIGSMFLVTFLYGFTFEILSFRIASKAQPIYLKNKS